MTQLPVPPTTRSVSQNCAAEAGTGWRCLPPSWREDLSVESGGRCPCTAAPRECAAAASEASSSVFVDCHAWTLSPTRYTTAGPATTAEPPAPAALCLGDERVAVGAGVIRVEPADALLASGGLPGTKPPAPIIARPAGRARPASSAGGTAGAGGGPGGRRRGGGQQGGGGGRRQGEAEGYRELAAKRPLMASQDDFCSLQKTNNLLLMAPQDRKRATGTHSCDLSWRRTQPSCFRCPHAVAFVAPTQPVGACGSAVVLDSPRLPECKGENSYDYLRGPRRKIICDISYRLTTAAGVPNHSPGSGANTMNTAMYLSVTYNGRRDKALSWHR